MFLVVGLGNPGARYENTRHNAGFCAVDFLAGPGATWKSEHKALTCRLSVSGREVLLAKPQTFMNLSGEAVQALMNWYKIKKAELLVFSDDVNLDLGRLRVRAKGSHGGQNGLKNIIEKIGDDFVRVRIGVGKCPAGWELSNWVLSKFSEGERADFLFAAGKAPEVLREFFAGGVERCMDKFNGPLR